MIGSSHSWDAIVLGGGYFGCRVALRLAERGMRRILLVDEQSAIMARASLWNQARVHGGYHYPRAYLTALASRRSYRRFLVDHIGAVTPAMRSLYAVARGSRVSPSQFERLCASIGAPLSSPPAEKRALLDSDLIEAVYEVEEAGFNGRIIADQMRTSLEAAGVDVRLGVKARLVEATPISCTVDVGGSAHRAGYVYNCTYAALDSVGIPLRGALKREWTEMVLIDPPAALEGWAVTVMDGPFFSTMPFPSLGCHTLSHVRFTPLCAWQPSDRPATDAVEGAGTEAGANAHAMLRDATRYLPKLREARIRGAIHSVKTVLDANERDDGRPLLVQQMEGAPNVVSVLGSKLDTVYDVLGEIDDLLEGAPIVARREFA